MKFDKESLPVLKDLLEVLNSIRHKYETGEPLSGGLCGNVWKGGTPVVFMFDEWTDKHSFKQGGPTLWSDWEHFSGCNEYPIPHSYEGYMEEGGYEVFKNNPSHLAVTQFTFLPADKKWEGEQGELRYSLTLHCIKKVESKIKELEECSN